MPASQSLDPNLGPLLASSPPAGIAPDQIIRKFATRETEFKHARKNYTYRETVRFDTFDREGKVDGEYLEVDDIVFASTGQRRERVLYAPESTLTRVAMSPADFGDIEHRLPFTLTESNISQYRVTYVGQQTIHRLPAYVFDVAPKRIEKGRRYFSGRIWVDAKDDQIIMSQGKGVPDDTIPGQEDLSLPFTTWRQKVDGKYWFPAYTRAEGVLHFRSCAKCAPQNVHIRETVRYSHYQRFGSKVRILYDGIEIPGETALTPPVDPANRANLANRP